MGDSIITIVAIFLAAILMFIFPLMSLSERSDDIAQLSVQTTTAEFVDNIRATGKLTLDDYDKFLNTLTATGNSFDVDIQIQKLDENPGVKVTQGQKDKIGENIYYSVYTSQIMDELNANNEIKLKEGDIVSVTVKNTNKTISQLLRNFFYRVSGNDTYQISAQHGGIVMVNAN
ncbi:MAG: hypothetical protein ACLUF5_01140 [Clostridia bacterium]|jgi:hypothetical protein|nr:putative uncharacterized protein [Clostridium sp. CAG:798]HBJ12319.1 hypothetical protein [Clostridiales bacterium]